MIIHNVWTSTESNCHKLVYTELISAAAFADGVKLYSNYISVLEIAGHFLGLVRSAVALEIEKGSIILTTSHYVY